MLLFGSKISVQSKRCNTFIAYFERKTKKKQHRKHTLANTTVAHWLSIGLYVQNYKVNAFQCECNYTLANNREMYSLLFNTSSVIF